jgi:hypothetical protein
VGPSAKASDPIVGAAAPSKYTLGMVWYQKAREPMLVTLLGIVILVRPFAPANAELPMLASLLGETNEALARLFAS